MKRILQIVSSPRGAASYSNQLGQAIIDQLQAAHPGSTVQTIDLSEQHYPHLSAAQLNSFFTPEEARTSEHHHLTRHSDEAAANVLAADILVICAPVWNFNIPSALKAWLDHIIRSGITFRYGTDGPVGLVQNKKAYIALASGGVFSEGPYTVFDFAVPYLKAVFAFIGLTDVQVVRVEGTAIPGLQDTALEKAISSITI